MVNVTLSVPDDLKKEMDKFPEINWSVIFRESIRKRILILSKIREFTEDSKFSEEDALRLGREVKKELHRKYKDGFGR